MTRVRRSERGQTLMVFALGFALLLFLLVCFVADASYLAGWSGRVQGAAQLAAQSGADAVDPRYLYAGNTCEAHGSCQATIVDISAQDRRGNRYAFERACIEAGDQSGAVPRNAPRDLTPKSVDDPQTPEGTACASNGCRVWAAVTRVVTLPVPFPGFPGSLPVAGTAYAAPVVGSSHPGSTCTGSRWVPSPPP